MKHAPFYILILALFISCKSNTTKSTQDSLKSNPVNDSPTKIMAEFEPIMHGAWAKSSYVDKVIKTKSPLAAVDEAQDLTALLFDRNTIQGDSLMVLAGWGNHDSSEIPLRFKRGKREHSLSFGGGEIQYSVVNNDTLLTIYRPDEKTHRITGTLFKKSPVKKDELASALDYFINKGLVTGNYLLKDGDGNIINFLSGGELNGFLNFTGYNINIDLNSDAMDNLDEITFTNKDGNKSYSFKISADTLKLYETHPNADSTLLVLGNLKYTLIKQE